MISVIVPVYNVEQFLPACIGSIIAQTYKNLEIILVNDGSTDGSGKICELYAQEHSNITVITKPNGGLSDARNTGLNFAKGEFISFVDSDDLLHPKFYEILLRPLENNDVDMSSCNYVECLDESSAEQIDCSISKFSIISSAEAIRDFKLNVTNHIGVSACRKVYRKKLFDKIRFQKGIIYEDLELFPRILEKCNHIAWTDTPLYYYRIRAGSTIHSPFSKNNLDSLKILKYTIIPFYRRNSNLVNLDEAKLWYITEFLEICKSCRRNDLKYTLIPREYIYFFCKIVFTIYPKLVNKGKKRAIKIMLFMINILVLPDRYIVYI